MKMDKQEELDFSTQKSELIEKREMFIFAFTAYESKRLKAGTNREIKKQIRNEYKILLGSCDEAYLRKYPQSYIYKSLKDLYEFCIKHKEFEFPKELEFTFKLFQGMIDRGLILE
jgi:hypothetical protein